MQEAINKPYFARLDLSNYNLNTIYIGDRALPEVDKKIVDWREPVCQVYYLQNRVLFEKYGVELIRKFDIYQGSFCGYYDSYIRGIDILRDKHEIVDEFLLGIIKKQRENPVIHDIIQTIQDIQYKIISEKSNKNIIVLGCAGSGKTMVLVHRLSYLLYNNKDLSNSKIKIITPNKNLNVELDQLAQKLELSNIPRYTLEEYWLDLIRRYCKLHRIYKIPSLESLKYDVDMLEDDDNIDPNVRDEIRKIDFSSEYRKFEENEYDLIVLRDVVRKFVSEKEIINCRDRREFLNYFQSKFSELIEAIEIPKKLYNENKKFNLVSEFKKRALRLNRTEMEFLNDIDIALRKLTELKENGKIAGNGSVIESIISKLNIVEELIISKTIYSNLDKISFTFEEENFLNENAYFGMKHVKEEVYKDRKGNRTFILLSPFSYFKQELIDKKRAFDEIQTVFETFKKYMVDTLNYEEKEITLSQVEDFIIDFYNLNAIVLSLADFLEGKELSYFTFIWKCFIEQIKNKYKIPLEKKYQFELYALLEVLYHKFGELPEADKYLFIDEAQDLLAKEIMLTAKVNGMPFINAFGDKLQKTRLINQEYFFENLDGNNYDIYELDVNYRNSKQITEYINKRCSLSMKSIGLDGVVEVIEFSKLSTLAFHDLLKRMNSRRKVLILKDLNALEKLKNKVNINMEEVNVIFDSRRSFSENKLNILNIKSAKGLEFPEVIVFDYNLQLNELYIACSRALEKLIVIEYR
ncbi:UvrD-helicase domain-containing protein [Caldicellulosiruptor kronotskyensis]|uniref:UvrD-helicase domain-containing protein n=1 Tax=Caldicellulosiruptor kronotskyensis TaxID=413889 RepID=UPI0001E9B266|nr:UvrD-helicase domain-containing protein [Caldicellulosiruptor kronotskyensis]